MTDDRQKTVDAIVAKMRSGERLDEEYVNGYLHLARDHILMVITTAVLKEKMPGKSVISAFNCLQNAVERYELTHKAETRAVLGSGSGWSVFTNENGERVPLLYDGDGGDA